MEMECPLLLHWVMAQLNQITLSRMTRVAPPLKFDVIREEHWGGPPNSNPDEWDVYDTSGRQETGCTGISARPPHTGGTADEPVVAEFWD